MSGGSSCRGAGVRGRAGWVGQEEQGNSDVWVRNNKQTKMCGLGGTNKFRFVDHEEQTNSNLWIGRNKQSQVCGSGVTNKLICVGQA